MSLFSRDKSRLSFPVRVEDFLGREVNEARNYGVLVRAAHVPPGQTYWRVLHVRHLSPEENRGGHYIYVDVLDESGRRVPGAEVEIRWDGGHTVERVQPRENRPGVRFPMDKWSIYEVALAGLPSERVIGLTASHPGEGRGNAPFRHSFLIVWQRATREVEAMPPEPPQETVVEEPVGAPAEATAEQAPSPNVEEVPSPEDVAAAAAGTMAAQPSREATAEEVATEVPREEVETVEPETSAQAAPPSTAEEHAPTEEELSPEEGDEETSAPPPEAEAPPVEAEAAPAVESPAEEPIEATAQTAPSAVVAPLPLYVLFADGQDSRILAAFFVVLEQLEKARVPFGFDTWDAARHARRVVVIGQPEAAKLEELRQAVEDVVLLESESTTLKEQFENALGVG